MGDEWLDKEQQILSEDLNSMSSCPVKRVNLFPQRAEIDDFAVKVVFGPCMEESTSNGDDHSAGVENSTSTTLSPVFSNEDATTSKSQIFIMFVRGHGKLETNE